MRFNILVTTAVMLSTALFFRAKRTMKFGFPEQ